MLSGKPAEGGQYTLVCSKMKAGQHNRLPAFPTKPDTGMNMP
jgi:hypothetical protein